VLKADTCVNFVKFYGFLKDFDCFVFSCEQDPPYKNSPQSCCSVRPA